MKKQILAIVYVILMTLFYVTTAFCSEENTENKIFFESEENTEGDLFFEAEEYAEVYDVIEVEENVDSDSDIDVLFNSEGDDEIYLSDENEETNIVNAINEHASEPETVSVKGMITWDDSDNIDGIRPAYNVIKLYADGILMEKLTVTEDDGWKYEFNNLPKYSEKGELIMYMVTEDFVDGYRPIYDVYSITNIHDVKPEEDIVEDNSELIETGIQEDEELTKIEEDEEIVEVEEIEEIEEDEEIMEADEIEEVEEIVKIDLPEVIQPVIIEVPNEVVINNIIIDYSSNESSNEVLFSSVDYEEPIFSSVDYSSDRDVANNTTLKNVPLTGDNSKIVFMTVLMLLALTIALGCFSQKVRKCNI